MSSRREEMQARLSKVLERGLPGFRELASLTRLSAGASQETYRIVARTDAGERLLAMRRNAGGVWFEQPEPGRAGVDCEALLMRLAREAGVPEPEVLVVLEQGDELGGGFVMEWLEGETLGARIVRAEHLDAVRPRLARQCGEMLARIHAIDLESSGLATRLQHLEPRAYVEQTFAGYKLLGMPQPMIDYTARWLLDHLPGESRRTLVHNDFRNGNIMVGEEGVVAVLDWELAHIGDPMRDLGWICTNSWRFGRRDLPVGGFGERADLFAGYESVTGEPVDPEHVRFWEVFGSFWWAIGCMGMGNQFRMGPDPSVERAAVGRRSSECQVDCVNLLIPGPVDVIEPPTERPNLDLPRIDELVSVVGDHLRGDVMEATEGRTRFLSRVASNALDIVQRELAVGEVHRRLERERLAALLGEDAELEPLRWRLVESLRSGELALDAPGLAEHLRATVVNQVAIDQPRYSGFLAAAEESSPSPG
jgi:aminoglycoside phosphotransferase (APT) family kinase protein